MSAMVFNGAQGQLQTPGDLAAAEAPADQPIYPQLGGGELIETVGCVGHNRILYGGPHAGDEYNYSKSNRLRSRKLRTDYKASLWSRAKRNKALGPCKFNFAAMLAR